MTITTTNLVGYWHYKQGMKGNTWYNIAPSTKGQYNGAINGATFTEKGMYFDGVDDFIEILNFMTTVDRPTIQVGIIREQKTPQTNNSMSLVTSSYNSSKFTLWGNTNDGDWELAYMQGSTLYNITSPVTADTQQYLSLSKTTPSVINFSFNDAWTGTYNSTAIIPFGGTLNIGRETGGGNNFKGWIQYVRIYDRPLTDTEMATNYNLKTDVGLDIGTTGASVVPTQPTSFRALKNHPLYNTLAWDYQADANQYILKRNGEIIYQGNDNVITTTPLKQKTTYNYELYASNEIGISTITSLQVITPALTAIDLPVNAKIKMGRQEFVGKTVNGTEDIIWRIASQGHWLKDNKYPQNATTLITDKIIRFQLFDIDEVWTQISGQYVQRIQGSTQWWSSNIRQWLNSDAGIGQWYKPKSPNDRPPSAENITRLLNQSDYYFNKVDYYNLPYDQDSGFMKYFTNIEKSVLKPTVVTTEYMPNEFKEEPALWMTDYFFLAGNSEILGGYSNDYSGFYIDGIGASTSVATDLAWANYSKLTQPVVADAVVQTRNAKQGATIPSGIKPLCNINGTTLMEEILDEFGVGTGIYKVSSEQVYNKKYPSVTTIKELPIDTIVKIGTNKFENKRINGEERMLWRVISKNHWKKDSGYPINGVTMASERIVKYMAFGAIDVANGFSDGQSQWIWSTISKWLNSNGLDGTWFTSSSMTPNKPDYEHILKNVFNQPYDLDDGFLSYFTTKERNAILETTILTKNNSTDQPNTYSVFLPSFVEVTGQEYTSIAVNGEGRLLSIDHRDFLSNSLDTDLAFYNSPNYNMPETRNNRKPYWWRTSGITGSSFDYDARYNASFQWYGTSDLPAKPNGIRPLFNINGDTEVHLTEFINGIPVYEIEDSIIIESTGYEWSNDQPNLNPPIIPPDTTAPREVGTVSTVSEEKTVTINWTNPTDSDFSYINIYQNGHLAYANVTGTTITIQNLVAGTTYSFMINTVDVKGNESAGTAFTATTILVDRTAPLNVTNLSSTFTDSSVTLTWVNPTDLDFSHLRLYQNGVILNNEFNGTTVTINSLPPSMTQTFKITSFDLSGNESDGEIINVKTSVSVAPDDVRNLNATKTHNSVTLYWDKPTNSDYSHAKVLVDGVTLVNLITDTKVTITGLTDDTLHTFKVIAVDLTNNESSGVTISVKTYPTPDSTAPSNVTNLSASSTNNTVTLSWTNPTDSDYTNTKIYSEGKIVKDNVTTTSVTINGLNTLSDYIFKVVAVDKAGNMSNGASINVTTLDSPTGDYYTFGDLPIGSKVKLGKMKFGNEEESIYWTVIDKDHYRRDSGYPTNGVTLITDKNIKYTQFDVYNDWVYRTSELNSWLQNSIKTGFSEVEKNALLEAFVKVKNHGGYGNENGFDGFNAKFFIPSSAELHDSYADSENGALFQYFVNNTASKYTSSQQLAFQNANLIGTVDTLKPYWLRDTRLYNADGLWAITVYSRYNTTDDATRVGEETDLLKKYGVRPITNINRSTRIEKVVGEVGVYKILGTSDLPPSVVLPPSPQTQLQGAKENNGLIHVLNPQDLSIEGIVDNYASASMTANYNSIGDFIIIINNRIENAMLFVKEKYVVFNGDGKFTGIITSVQIELDSDGNEVRTIKGKTLGHLLSYRVIAMPDNSTFYDSYNGLGEKAIKYYVKRNTNEAPVDKDVRSFPRFTVAQDKNLGQTIERRYYYENLLDVVEEITQLQDLGYEIYYDSINNNIVFDVYYGKDLSVNQTQYSPIVLSAQFGNLEGQTYMYDEGGQKNFAYINRNDFDPYGSQAQVIKLPNGENIGVQRKEIFYKIDSQEKGYFIPSNVLGAEKLNAQKSHEMFEVQIMDNQMFTYGIDYKLGDIVTISNEAWSVSNDLRIVGVTLDMNENQEYNISLTFGDILPSLTDKISNMVDDHDPNKHKQW